MPLFPISRQREEHRVRVQETPGHNVGNKPVARVWGLGCRALNNRYTTNNDNYSKNNKKHNNSESKNININSYN